VFVTLITLHAKCMRCIMLSLVASPALPRFLKLSQTARLPGK